MAKKWMTLLLSLTLLVSACSFVPKSLTHCSTLWEGEIGEEFVQQVRADLNWAETWQCSKLRVDFLSPGGSVVWGLEVVREMKAARARGLIIEMHGNTFIASMATVVLAAGSPGYRYIDYKATTLIHNMSVASGPYGEPVCLWLVFPPKTENDKIANVLIQTFARTMAELTGNPYEVTLSWLECDKAQAGNGVLLVKLGFADKLDGTDYLTY